MVEIRLRYGYSWTDSNGEVCFVIGSATINIAFTLDLTTGDGIVVISAGTGSVAIIKTKSSKWINVTVVFYRTEYRYRSAEIYVSTESRQTVRGYGEPGLPRFSARVIWGQAPG